MLPQVTWLERNSFLRIQHPVVAAADGVITLQMPMTPAIRVWNGRSATTVDAPSGAITLGSSLVHTWYCN